MAPPPLTEANVRHLLRRTEFVDRPHRVAHLLTLGSIDAAVDDVLDVAPHPPSVTFTSPADRDWERGQDLTHFWLDQMARDPVRPFQERRAISLTADAGELDVIADVVGCFTTDGASIVPVAPSRLLDTRHGHGARKGPVGAGADIDLTVLGVGGVDPAATAVVLNVTATGATEETYVTVYPEGIGRPDASSLNVARGATIANLVVAKVGANGKVRLFNHAGGVELIGDVTGYFI